jgi:RimJ/RimL family protein N-acetyltransferase
MTSYVEAALAEVDLGRRVCFTIFRSTDGIIVGSTSLFDFSFPDRRLEIGHTWLSPSAQRTAINTECKLLLLQYAFEALGCVRVQLKTDVRNARSRRAIERIGGAFEGTLRKLQTRYDGYVRDTAIYSITSDDWHVVLANLIGHLARR